MLLRVCVICEYNFILIYFNWYYERNGIKSLFYNIKRSVLTYRLLYKTRAVIFWEKSLYIILLVLLLLHVCSVYFFFPVLIGKRPWRKYRFVIFELKLCSLSLTHYVWYFIIIIFKPSEYYYYYFFFLFLWHIFKDVYMNS